MPRHGSRSHPLPEIDQLTYDMRNENTHYKTVECPIARKLNSSRLTETISPIKPEKPWLVQEISASMYILKAHQTISPLCRAED